MLTMTSLGGMKQNGDIDLEKGCWGQLYISLVWPKHGLFWSAHIPGLDQWYFFPVLIAFTPRETAEEYRAIGSAYRLSRGI